MKRTEPYLDVSGDPIPLDGLDAEERRFLARLRRRAATNPDWDDFDNYWTVAVPAFYVARGLPRKAVTKTTLWQIAQDLSGRLGIAQGHISPPDHLDDLEELLLFKYNASLPTFCKATGLPQDLMRDVLNGLADVPFGTLAKGLERIGLRLRIMPAAPPIELPRTPGKRGKRAARSA